jgi:hypothetical protein
MAEHQMKQKLLSQMNNIIEKLGLDWFVLLIGKPAFEDSPSLYPYSLPEVKEKFGDLHEVEKLEDAMVYCTNLLEREDKRLDKIESKAFTLIGITGIAAGFITGFASIILDQNKFASAWILVPAVLLYILVVISLMLTILLAVKVVAVGEYKFTYPSANDIFELSVKPLNDVKADRVSTLFFCFSQNNQIVDRKATFLNGSQRWFRNSILLLLSISILIASYTLFKQCYLVNVVLSPTVTATVQQSILPINPPILTSTSTQLVQTPTHFKKPQVTKQPASPSLKTLDH